VFSFQLAAFGGVFSFQFSVFSFQFLQGVVLVFLKTEN